MKKYPYIFVIILFFAACSTQKRSPGADLHAKQVIDYARKYLKTPYCSGGMSPKCFDCSGYCCFVYKKFNYTLPRTTTAQAKVGSNVKKKNIKPGDLVIFKGSNQKAKKPGHSGIVTEVRKNGEFMFIHSSTSKGVIISSSEQAYYKSRYITARRVIR